MKKHVMVCQDCSGIIGESNSCEFSFIQISGITFRRKTTPIIVDGHEPERCIGCGVVNDIGNVHHYGCRQEECPNPVCNGNGKMVGCWCLDKCRICGTGESREPKKNETKGCEGCEMKSKVKLMTEDYIKNGMRGSDEQED